MLMCYTCAWAAFNSNSSTTHSHSLIVKRMLRDAEMHAFLSLMCSLCLPNEYAKFKSSWLQTFKLLQMVQMYSVSNESCKADINPKDLTTSLLYSNSVWYSISSHKSFISCDPIVWPPAARYGNKIYQFHVISELSPESAAKTSTLT